MAGAAVARVRPTFEEHSLQAVSHDNVKAAFEPDEVACAYCFGLQALLQCLGTLAGALHEFVAGSGRVADAALYFVAFDFQCDSFFE